MIKMSIKWKLSLALIATGLVLVIAYIFVAKRVFESDKISYVFESQDSRINAQKREIEQHFERALLTARSVIATFDADSGLLSPAGDQIFQEEKALLALELWNEKTNQVVFRVEKVSGVLPVSHSDESQLTAGSVEISPLSSRRFLLRLKYDLDRAKNYLVVRAVVEFKNLLPSGETSQALILTQKGRFVTDSEGNEKINPLFESLLAEISRDNMSKTMMWGSGSQRYLVSMVNIGVGDFKILALTPEEVALGALGTLFKRSLIFLLFSTFGLIAVSLTLARGLTLNLAILTQAAVKIGQGHFDALATVQSQDEMGVLSDAMSKMSGEIQRLLVETRDKARMEAELKTASLVQESLLPNVRSFRLNEIEISGVALTSTECGGDWWYYFHKGNDLYVVIADATGHGTPAALITAAARSVFSRLEEEDLSLEQMMQSWDTAVRSCSSGRVFMTGILMKIDTVTGKSHYLSAGHEAPYWFRKADAGFDCDFLSLDVNQALGEGALGLSPEQSFQLEPNESLLLFTDGLFSVDRPDGKKLSEKRFGKGLASEVGHAGSADDVLKGAVQLFEAHRQDIPLPDDLTMVAIRRLGAV